MGKTSLSAPWVTYYKELYELFGFDREIRIEPNDDLTEIKFYIENEEKAEALTKILPEKKVFGNVVVKIQIIPANLNKNNNVSVYEKAFKGNPVFRFVRSNHSSSGWNAEYVVFAKKVVQFYNDDLSDLNRNKTTLYQDIASSTLKKDENVFFCTDTEDIVGK